MKTRLLSCAIALTTLLMAHAVAQAAETAARPNVIFYLVDDMGWMDSTPYGSQYYDTPNIERLARGGVRFTDAYACPLCSPTRASVLSGQYSARHGILSATGHLPPQPAGHDFLPDSAPANRAVITPESKNYLEPSQYTLAEALRDAGYRTAHIGKWHLGLTPPYWPEKQGFDIAFHCHPDPGPPGGYFSPYGVIPEGEPVGQTRVGTITDGPAGEYIVDRLADEAIRFIDGAGEQPFYLNLWQYGVHGPWGHKAELTKRYVDRKDPRGLQSNPIMVSMLKSVDDCLGRILDHLDERGLADNTIVMLMGDNGGNTHSNITDPNPAAKLQVEQIKDWRKWAGHLPPTNNAPLRMGKGTLYEGGTRVPLIARWPGKATAGAVRHDVVGAVDIYPTLCELVGVDLSASQKIDGVSFAKLLLDPDQKLDRVAYFNFFPGGKTGGVWVRSGDWKLIRFYSTGPSSLAKRELYNLGDDIGETNNLADDNPAKVAELEALIDAFLKDTNALEPIPNPAYARKP